MCLENIPLSKNQRLKKCLEAMFGKLALRTKKVFFPLLKFHLAKHDLKLMDSAQPDELGFLAQSLEQKTEPKIKKKDRKKKKHETS
jgi:hypothetical protein